MGDGGDGGERCEQKACRHVCDNPQCDRVESYNNADRVLPFKGSFIHKDQISKIHYTELYGAWLQGVDITWFCLPCLTARERGAGRFTSPHALLRDFKILDQSRLKRGAAYRA